MSRATPREREQFIATLLAKVPTATRADALRLLRWGATYGRLMVEECSGDWPIRRRDQSEWRKLLDAQVERAERIIRETCDGFARQHRPGMIDRPWAVPYFQGDPRGHTVRLQIAGEPLDPYERPALAIPTS